MQGDDGNGATQPGPWAMGRVPCRLLAERFIGPLAICWTETGLLDQSPHRFFIPS
jgi:hypothetical protein